LKKLVALALVTAMALFLVACASKTADSTTIKVAGLKGPTSIGMVKLMEENDNGTSKNKYEFTLAGSSDEVTPKLIQGELDMAAVPANLASVLYNKTHGQIQIIAINTLGVLYIVDRAGQIKTVQDLKGKTIYGSGKGSTPEYSLRYILKENGLDPDKDVHMEWKSEHTEVVQTLASDDQAIGLLPQPFVTVAKGKIEDLNIALDLTKEWEAIDNESTLITGVLAVRRDFAKEHPDELKSFLEEYSASVKYTNENVDDAARLCEKYDIIKEAVARQAIPYCNIVFIENEDMEPQMDKYLKVLYDADPMVVGGTLPDKDFYYVYDK